MALNQGHEQDNRTYHNISSNPCQRCEVCDAHYYWCHLDDTQKYFFKFMIGDFQEKMSIPEKFVGNFKGQISEVIKLEGPDGNRYDVQATRDLNKIVLRSGWTTFATFYELKERCVLVFRYSGDSHFRVLIFDYPCCCEKEVFHVVMNCGPNAQEKDTRVDQSPVCETQCQNGGSGNGESRQRCGHCDVHFYWQHLDDRKKHFMRLMIGDFQGKMSIPVKFVKNFRGRISEVIKLEAPDGNIYDIKVVKDANKIVLGSGWAAFVNANGLKDRDLLVFRYNGDSDFKVLMFEPSGCEKQLFHVVMNHASNVQDRGVSHDQSFPGETRRRDVGSHDSNSRKTRKMTPLDSPSPRSAEGVTSDTMNSDRFPETTEPRYILATGCNLTTAQKAELNALVKKIRPLIPLYITAISKTSLSGSLVFCKDYAAKYLPHEDQFIALYPPQNDDPWFDYLKVITDGSCMLSAGWSCFVRHNELRIGKEPESRNNCSYPVESGETEEEECYKANAESDDYYYSTCAKCLTSKEKNELLRSASIQLGNLLYVTMVRESHLRSRNNMMNIPRKLGAEHFAPRTHDILLLRPNRKEEWWVRYYYRKSDTPCFTCNRWTKFVGDNKLRVGDVCIFELLKGMSKVTMMVHIFRKVGDMFVLLD